MFLLFVEIRDDTVGGALLIIVNGIKNGHHFRQRAMRNEVFLNTKSGRFRV